MAILYEIVNKVTNNRYIGVTTMTLKQRWNVHIYKLRHKIATQKIQCAFNEYGESSFVINCIKTGDLEDMLLIEKELTKETVINGYNTIIGGGDSDERKSSAKIFRQQLNDNSILMKNYLTKISNGNKGKVVSKESRKKMSESKMGKKWENKHKENRSKLYSGIGNPNYGNFKLYLNTSTGVYYTTPELLLFIGVRNIGLNKLFNKNDTRVNNFIKV